MKILLIIYLTVLFGVGYSQSNRFLVAEKYHQTSRDFLLKGQYDTSIVYLDSALALMPYGFELYFERGYANMQQEKFENAITDFSIIINKADYKYEAYFNRGVCFFQIGDLEKAKFDFLRLLELDPQNKRAEEYLAQIGLNENYKTVNSNQFSSKKKELRENLYWQRRRNERLIWGTVIPIVFWTTVFLTW